MKRPAGKRAPNAAFTVADLRRLARHWGVSGRELCAALDVERRGIVSEKREAEEGGRENG